MNDADRPPTAAVPAACPTVIASAVAHSFVVPVPSIDKQRTCEQQSDAQAAQTSPLDVHQSVSVPCTRRTRNDFLADLLRQGLLHG